MSLYKEIYLIGAFTTAVLTTAAVLTGINDIQDLKAAHKHANVNADQRVVDCGKENQQCMTSHKVLDECLGRKAAAIATMQSDISKKSFGYTLIGIFGLGWSAFSWRRARREDQAVPDHPAP